MSEINNGKKIAIVFCMHRSGSSFTTNLLAELGMSIGNFATSPGTPTNKYGKYEARPLVSLNRKLQQSLYGFSEDIPEDMSVLTNHVGVSQMGMSNFPSEYLVEAEKFIHELLATGQLCGCKDPRMVLTWPVWKTVLAEFKGVKLFPIILLRSPHEIAMSLFSRSKGRYVYEDCLDVVSLHFRCLHAIAKEYNYALPILCFGSSTYKSRLKKAVADLGLKWDEEKYDQIFDKNSVHQKPAYIDHKAQELFDQFDTGAIRPSEQENKKLVQHDLEVRRALLERLAVGNDCDSDKKGVSKRGKMTSRFLGKLITAVSNSKRVED